MPFTVCASSTLLVKYAHITAAAEASALAVINVLLAWLSAAVPGALITVKDFFQLPERF